ncbi:MAG: HpcH/HpaI aldolase family protein [Gammaproteobacteria bacterium]
MSETDSETDSIGARASSSTPLNPLKARLDAGKPGVGVLVSVPGVPVAQILATAGFDWLFIDMEHCPIDIASAHAMIVATMGTDAAPIVRVPKNLPWLVQPVLDAGAMGVVFPMIKNADEARAAVATVRYPPTGVRGFGPLYATRRFGTDFNGYPDLADREILCILLIEHQEAVENIAEIVAVPGIDVCFIAPFDLAMSFGYRDGPDHPEVHRAVAAAEHAILKSKITLGGLALDAGLANSMIRRGYRLILGGFDTQLLDRSSAALLNAVDREGPG